MSIEERLSVIDLSPAEGRKGVHKGGLPLQTDSFAVLLVQGLESSDSNILNVSVHCYLVYSCLKKGFIQKDKP